MLVQNNINCKNCVNYQLAKKATVTTAQTIYPINSPFNMQMEPSRLNIIHPCPKAQVHQCINIKRNEYKTNMTSVNNVLLININAKAGFASKLR